MGNHSKKGAPSLMEHRISAAKVDLKVPSTRMSRIHCRTGCLADIFGELHAIGIVLNTISTDHTLICTLVKRCFSLFTNVHIRVIHSHPLHGKNCRCILISVYTVIQDREEEKSLMYIFNFLYSSVGKHGRGREGEKILSNATISLFSTKARVVNPRMQYSTT